MPANIAQFQVGRQEQHALEYVQHWFRQDEIRVDGKLMAKKKEFRRSVTVNVGTEEKHVVRVKSSLFPLFTAARIYIDGRDVTAQAKWTCKRGVALFRGAIIAAVVILVGSLVIALMPVSSLQSFGFASSRIRGGQEAGAENSAKRISDREYWALVEKLKKGTVLVWSVFGENVFKGSGVVLKKWGRKCLGITNRHVVVRNRQLASRIVVVPHGYESAQNAYLLDFFGSETPFHDVAFFVFYDSKDMTEVIPLASGNSAVQPGEVVVAVGNPEKEVFHHSEGSILAYGFRDSYKTEPLDELLRQLKNREFWEARIIVHNARIGHGSSGGGLFTASGRFVGMNTWSTEKESLAIDVRNLLIHYRVKSFDVSAKADHWQDSGISVFPGESVMVLATGEWQMGAWAGKCGPAGMTGYESYSFSREHDHGALLCKGSDSDPIIAVAGQWKSALSQGDISFALAELPVSHVGNLLFRINDTGVSNNDGTISVTVLIEPNK